MKYYSEKTMKVYDKVEELKTEMKKLETIFLSNFGIIEKIQSDKNIKKKLFFKTY